MSEMSGLGRSRLTSVQQLGRGLKQDGKALRRDEALSRLWDDLNSSIRTREQVGEEQWCDAQQGGREADGLFVSSRVCSQRGRSISSITMWTS